AAIRVVRVISGIVRIIRAIPIAGVDRRSINIYGLDEDVISLIDRFIPSPISVTIPISVAVPIPAVTIPVPAIRDRYITPRIARIYLGPPDVAVISLDLSDPSLRSPGIVSGMCPRRRFIVAVRPGRRSVAIPVPTSAVTAVVTIDTTVVTRITIAAPDLRHVPR